MNKPATRLSYADRIARVVDHIAANLDATLTTERLAAVAHFSPYHFHRIYLGVTGETAGDTIRRYRLNRAATALTHGDRAIPAIAREAGYGGAAAFTRAFAAVYGATPGAYRRAHRGRDHRTANQQQESAMSHPTEIVTLPARRLFMATHIGHYHEMAAAFDRTAAWLGSRGLLADDRAAIAIYRDLDPSVVPSARRRTDVGFSVAPGVAATDGFKIVDLPGGRHAVMHHKGPYAELEAACSWLFGVWLPASGEETADRPFFDHYLNDCKALPPAEWRTDVCVPLADR
ncbi:MAG: AraC family transcriptional regulator [Rhodospirillales bacterium]|nr:MAG: AraC family transcriptional regulator [Rhodospirillales bacterium]